MTNVSDAVCAEMRIVLSMQNAMDRIVLFILLMEIGVSNYIVSNYKVWLFLQQIVSPVQSQFARLGEVPASLSGVALLEVYQSSVVVGVGHLW